jgi:hypothetical protein
MRVLALLAFTVLSTVPVVGQEQSSFRLIPTADGFIEIDASTGNVRECSRSLDGYSCKPASPDALRAAVETLARENTGFRERGSPGREPLTPIVPPKPSTAPTPSDQEFDRALNLMERFLRRFMSILREESPKRI